MKRAIYPGSFDPVTLGHLDVMKRSAVLVDELIVAVSTIEPSSIGNLAVTASSTASLCSSERSVVLNETLVEF